MSEHARQPDRLFRPSMQPPFLDSISTSARMYVCLQPETPATAITRTHGPLPRRAAWPSSRGRRWRWWGRAAGGSRRWSTSSSACTTRRRAASAWTACQSTSTPRSTSTPPPWPWSARRGRPPLPPRGGSRPDLRLKAKACVSEGLV